MREYRSIYVHTVWHDEHAVLLDFGGERCIENQPCECLA